MLLSQHFRLSAAACHKSPCLEHLLLFVGACSLKSCLHMRFSDGHTVAENIGSPLTSEVERQRARLGLGLGTAWEDIRALPAVRIASFMRVTTAVARHGIHRSHFGSRYKLGCCGNASLFAETSIICHTWLPSTTSFYYLITCMWHDALPTKF